MYKMTMKESQNKGVTAGRYDQTGEYYLMYNSANGRPMAVMIFTKFSNLLTRLADDGIIYPERFTRGYNTNDFEAGERRAVEGVLQLSMIRALEKQKKGGLESEAGLPDDQDLSDLGAEENEK